MIRHLCLNATPPCIGLNLSPQQNKSCDTVWVYPGDGETWGRFGSQDHKRSRKFQLWLHRAAHGQRLRVRPYKRMDFRWLPSESCAQASTAPELIRTCPCTPLVLNSTDRISYHIFDSDPSSMHHRPERSCKCRQLSSNAYGYRNYIHDAQSRMLCETPG